MRLLLISLYYAPDVASTGVFMARIMEDLVRQGHEVSVITSFPHYADYRTVSNYRSQMWQSERQNGVTVMRVPVYAPGRKTTLNRLINYFSFSTLCWLAGTTLGRFDIILVTSPPLTLGLSGHLLNLQKRGLMIYALQDIWPDVAFRVGAIQNGMVLRFFEQMERFIYAKSAHIIALTPGFRRNLLGKGVPSDKVSVIPYFVDTDFIRPLPRDNDFSRRMGFEGRFVVMHAGNVGLSQNLETMLEAAFLLRDQKDILFVIVGEGAAKADLVAEAQARELANVRFLTWQPHQDLPWLRASADVQLALLKRTITENSIPSKIYEAMASGRPVVASVEEGTDAWQLVAGSKAGLCIEPERPQQLAEAIMHLYSNEQLRNEMGDNGTVHIGSHYSRAAITQRYDQVFRQFEAMRRNSH